MTILLLGNTNLVYNETRAPFDLMQIPWVFGVEDDLSCTMALSVISDIFSSSSSIGVESLTESSYSVRKFISYDFVSIHSAQVSSAFVASNTGIHVIGPLTAKYSIGYIKKDVTIKYALRHMVEGIVTAKYGINLYYDYKELESPYGIGVSRDISSPYGIRHYLFSDIKSDYHLLIVVERDFDVLFDLAVTTTIEQNLRAVYTIYDPTSESIVTSVLATVGGKNIDFDSISLSSDDSSYCWTLTAQLSNMESWLECETGSVMAVSVGTDTYLIKIDSRDRSSQFGDNSYSVTGRSITSVYGEGAEPIHDTWEASDMHSIINGLIPTPTTITIPNWNIPDDLLISEGEVPISIVKRIAEAAGGIVYTKGDGTLMVVKKHKVSPTDYVTTSVDHIMSDLDDIYSISESRELRPGYNQVEVRDEPDSSKASVSIEQVSIDRVALKSVIKVTVFPFTNLLALNSSHNNVAIPTSTTPIFETITDTIEVVDGAGSVSKPIFDILSSSYQDSNMGAVTFSGTNITTEIAGVTLLKITYRTQYHILTVTAQEAEMVQIYTED